MRTTWSLSDPKSKIHNRLVPTRLGLVGMPSGPLAGAKPHPRVPARARGLGPTDHLFLYRNEPLCKDLVRDRVQAAGERAGVKVYPHRLRHTCATQLLNAGCRVTSIQKFLGHKRLNSTMIYARVHDRTVADDYYAAMDRIEQRLDVGPPPQPGPAGASLTGGEREQLLGLAVQLTEPNLPVETRFELVDRMCLLLKHNNRGRSVVARVT